MTSGSQEEREAAIDDMAIALPQEAAMLVRLVFREIRSDVSRPLAGLLRSVADGPRRISEIAEQEGLAQPTATALVDQAEKRGWVKRQKISGDGRVVVVSITPKGRAARRRLFREIRTVMHEGTASMTHEEIMATQEATRTLEILIAALRSSTE